VLVIKSPIRIFATVASYVISRWERETAVILRGFADGGIILWSDCAATVQ